MIEVPREVERRWLVDLAAVPIEVATMQGAGILQGYLTQPTAPISNRIRLLTQGADTSAWSTTKAKDSSAEGVAEIEYQVPLQIGQQLMSICLASIEKTRRSYASGMTHPISGKALVWELDQFHGPLNSLVIMELEVPSLLHPITVLPFLGPEVTGIKELSNQSLAFDPNKGLAIALQLMQGHNKR